MFEGNDERLVFLAFFDILGTSKLISSGQTCKVLELYEYITKLVSERHNRMCLGREIVGNSEAIPVVFSQYIWEAHFSDTFILWSNADGEPRFPPFLDACMDIFCKALVQEIPLCGCISIGNAVMNSKTAQYVGEPLRESAKGEAAQRWIGASFGKSSYHYPCYESAMYIPYSKHIKAGGQEDISLYALDWPRYWREHIPEHNVLDVLNRMDDQPDFTSYYTNTVDFVKFSEAHTDWWKTVPISSNDTDNPFEAAAKTMLDSGEYI
jgi:hypothetical protein